MSVYDETNPNHPNYPYWKGDFDREFKGFTVYYREDDWPLNTDDIADSYRVFMILCNNSPKSRKEVLNWLKNSTEENPIVLNNETFWTEKD